MLLSTRDETESVGQACFDNHVTCFDNHVAYFNNHVRGRDKGMESCSFL